MTQELNFFWKTMTHGIEPFLFIWLTEWNPSFQFDSKNWTLFKILLKELNPCQHMTRRIEPFFKILPIELNPFQHMTRRIEHFCNRTFSIWLKGWNFSNMIWRIEPFLIWPKELTFLRKNESNIWTLFQHDSKNWFFFILFQYLSLILKLAHRIDFLKLF